MNIRAIANAAIQPINPDIVAGYQVSNGTTVNAAGKQTPTYAASVPVRAQVQAVKGSDLEHIANLNTQNIYRNVRIAGNAQGVVRPDAKGGDLMTFPQVPAGTVQTWLVVAVLETWPDWCSVIVCLQVS